MRADYGSGPTKAEPRDNLRRRHEKMLHEEQRDERPCPAEACLAVDSKSARFRFDNLEEPLEDLLCGVASVRKIQVVVIELSVEEFFAIIHFVVEAHYARDVVLAEVLEVSLGGVCLHAINIGDRCLCRTREGEELARHDPVEVAILDTLVVLVLVRVKVIMIVPSQRDSFVQASEAM